MSRVLALDVKTDSVLKELCYKKQKINSNQMLR